MNTIIESPLTKHLKAEAKGLTYCRKILADIEHKLIKVCPPEETEKLAAIITREVLDAEKDYLALYNLVPANESCSGIWFAWSQLCEHWRTAASTVKKLEKEAYHKAMEVKNEPAK